MFQTIRTTKKPKGSQTSNKVDTLIRAVKSLLTVLVVLIGLSFIVASGGGGGGSSSSSSGTISGSGQ